MYPVSIRLHGIRDFAPRRLDLGAKDDDVLLGGKNGAGKSTLVYALSFALGSARIAVDGLRSKTRHRKADAWDAEVAVLFHNPPGSEQKDAPEYVELVAYVSSPAGAERFHTTFSLRGGETPDKLKALRSPFSSRSEAREYYKRVFDIDADGYFMFWYQGSIAEFANISDQDRFKRVAQMFGLDRLEREWAAARREMAEAEDDFERAKTVALRKKMRLQALEQSKNELEQRDRIRCEGLLLLEATLTGLINIARGEEKAKRERLAAVKEQLALTAERRDEADRAVQRLTRREEELKKRRAAVREDIDRLSGRSNDRAQQIQARRVEKDELESKIAAVREKMRYIHRSREELTEEKGRLAEAVARLKEEIEDHRQTLDGVTKERDAVLRSAGQTEEERRRLAVELERLRRDDAALPPYAMLQQELTGLNAQRDAVLVEERRLADEVRELEREKQRLNERQSLLLPEQEKLLAVYRSAGIPAVSFGELCEVRGDADRAKVERVLGPLKHTVFVAHLLEHLDAERGFYVVPVDEVSRPGWFGMGERVPAVFSLVRMVEEVAGRYPETFIQGIRRWLAQVELVTGDEHPEMRGRMKLWRGLLLDNYGLRGPVDGTDAVGAEALEIARRTVLAALEEAERNHNAAVGRLAQLDADCRRHEEALRRRGEVDRRLPQADKDLAVAEQRLAELTSREKELTARITALEEERAEKGRRLTLCENAARQVDGELAVYAEHDHVAGEVERCNHLEQEIARLEEEDRDERRKLSALQLETERLGADLAGVDDELAERKTEFASLARECEDLTTRMSELQDGAESLALEAEEREGQLTGMRSRYAEIIAGLESSGRWILPDFGEAGGNRAFLERKNKEGRERLEDAEARRVDEEARATYEAYAYEFEQASKELRESEQRFNQLKRREEEQRDLLDKRVYDRWQRTNRYFGDFMRRLGMQGEVRSIPPDPEAANPQYRWELHVATQAGHRPEKISPESGHIVGEGISGGERAATSLVFALALLADITSRPPFYVLDEFDSALDEERKHEIFDLYRSVLGRKLIIVSPKVHGDRYLDRFGKFLCVVANPTAVPNRTVSEVYDVTRAEYVQVRGTEEE